MFASTAPTNQSASTAEASYIVKQNEIMHAECKTLREELLTAEKKHTEQLLKAEKKHADELRELQTLHDALEDDMDKSDASLRYLRNLQKTLAALHVESKEIADGYKSCDKQTRTVSANQTLFARLLGVAYVLGVGTAMFMDSTSAALVCGTSCFGLFGAYRFLFDGHKVDTQRCAQKRKELAGKEAEHAKAVAALPGIEELIDNV